MNELIFGIPAGVDEYLHGSEYMFVTRLVQALTRAEGNTLSIMLVVRYNNDAMGSEQEFKVELVKY